MTGRSRTRLGAEFGKLWAAVAVSNLGDGVYVTALPLLAASLTRDPLLVSLVTFAEWLPWLLFGLVSGALLDRWGWAASASACCSPGPRSVGCSAAWLRRASAAASASAR
jgi:MFS family permease